MQKIKMPVLRQLKHGRALLDEPDELSEDVPEEIVEYLCVEYNCGNYSPNLVKAFLMCENFQDAAISRARKQLRPDYQDLTLGRVNEEGDGAAVTTI